MGLCRGVFVLMSCIVLDAVPRCVCRTSSAFSVVNILIAKWQCIRIKCTKPCSNPTSYRSLPMIMSLLCIHAYASCSWQAVLHGIPTLVHI